MSQIGPGQNPYGPQPMMGPQQGAYPQPVVYRPGVPNVPMAGYAPDAYRPGAVQPTQQMVMGPNGRPVPAAPTQEKPYEYVNQKDVAFGIAGAAAGYFLLPMVCSVTGPIGALIAGLVLLGLSAGIRGIKHMSEKKQQQQTGINPMPNPPQYPNPAGQQPMYQNRYNYENQQMPGQQPRYPQQY